MSQRFGSASLFSRLHLLGTSYVLSESQDYVANSTNAADSNLRVYLNISHSRILGSQRTLLMNCKSLYAKVKQLLVKRFRSPLSSWYCCVKVSASDISADESADTK